MQADQPPAFFQLYDNQALFKNDAKRKCSGLIIAHLRHFCIKIQKRYLEGKTGGIAKAIFAIDGKFHLLDTSINIIKIIAERYIGLV
jgi:hypothetical protein